MQDDCSNKPFYKRRKQLIPPPRGVSFRTYALGPMLMLTWRLYYGGAVITSIMIIRLRRLCPFCIFVGLCQRNGGALLPLLLLGYLKNPVVLNLNS